MCAMLIDLRRRLTKELQQKPPSTLMIQIQMGKAMVASREQSPLFHPFLEAQVDLKVDVKLRTSTAYLYVVGQRQLDTKKWSWLISAMLDLHGMAASSVFPFFHILAGLRPPS